MAGCSGCSTGCNTTCVVGCANSCTSCTGGCTGNCAIDCSGYCSGACGGTCTGTCYTTCGGGCSGCTGSCSGGCSGCTGSCTDACSNGCTGGNMTTLYNKLLNHDVKIMASDINNLLTMLENEINRRGKTFLGNKKVTQKEIADYILAQNMKNNLASMSKSLSISNQKTKIPAKFYEDCAVLLRELYHVNTKS